MSENQSAQPTESVLMLTVPYSDFSRFDGSGRLNELGNVSEASGKAMNPVKRFVVSTVGIFFLMVGLVGLSGGANLLSIMCICFGILIVWTFIGRPEIQRKKQKLAAKQGLDPEISVIFNKHNIIMRSQQSELKRDWSEFVQYKKTKRGIHLNFSDGTEAWLPLTSFYDGELKALTSLLDKKN